MAAQNTNAKYCDRGIAPRHSCAPTLESIGAEVEVDADAEAVAKANADSKADANADVVGFRISFRATYKEGEGGT